VNGPLLHGGVAVLKGASLGNLCLVNLWYHILDTRPARYYALYRPASRARYCASLVNLAVLSAVFTLVFIWEGSRGTLASVVALVLGLLLCVQLAVVYRTAHDHLQPLRRSVRLVLGKPSRRAWARVVCVAVIVWLVAWAWVARLDATIRAVADVLSYVALPLLPWSIWRTARFAVQGHPMVAAMQSANARLDARVAPPGAGRSSPKSVEADGAAVREAGSRPRPRVLWLIFDECDYGILFDRRPPGVVVPHFDRLVSESLFCTDARPPAHCTELSMPALLSGLRVAGTWPLSPWELLIATRTSGQETLVAEDPRLKRVLWSEQPTVFSRARALGVHSAMTGWYHPYSRIIGQHLDWCAWQDDPEPAFAVRSTFWGALSDHFRGLLETGRYSVFGQSLTVRKAVRQHEAIRADARALATDGNYGLVVVHWPLPHAPFFFNAKRGRNTAANRGPAGYLDHLVLTDAMLGELMTSLASSGVESATTVIVTSDHWWRASSSLDGHADHRVPFIVRLPRGADAVTWRSAYETVTTGELVLALLTGEVQQRADLVSWLASAGTSLSVA
jgi:hypothetical protein